MGTSTFPSVSLSQQQITDIVDGINTLGMNLTAIDGAATAGNNATLNLKQLNIVNSAGTALVAQSTGSNGNGISAFSHGSGQGLSAIGGTTGIGILAYGGSASGHGAIFRAQAGIGDGIHSEALGSDGDGFNVTAAVGAGIYAQGGGTTGPGIAAVSTATSAPGIYALGNANNGIGAFGNGSAAGIQARGGLTGAGIEGFGGANGGSGAYFEADAAGAEGLVGYAAGAGAPGIAAYSTSGGVEADFGNINGTLRQTWSKSDIVTNTTTTIKSGAGFIHAININKGAATSTITVYDNTAGSGTKIGGVIVDTLAGGTSVILDSVFSTGLTVVTAGGAAADITVTYK